MLHASLQFVCLHIEVNASMFECGICHQHARRTLSGILRHIREVHPHFRGKVPCGVQGCPSTTSSYESLRQHMYRYHRELLNLSAAVHHSQMEQDTEESMEYSNNDSLPSEDTNESGDCPPSSTILGAQFILKTRDGKNLTQAATDGVVRDTINIVQSTVKLLEGKVFEKLQDIGIDLAEEQREEMKTLFSNETLTNPFKDLETKSKQERFIQKNFNFVVSAKISFNRDSSYHLI